MGTQNGRFVRSEWVFNVSSTERQTKREKKKGEQSHRGERGTGLENQSEKDTKRITETYPRGEREGQGS